LLKIPALKAIAPNQTEPPFLITQLSVLMLFIALGTVAIFRFRSEQVGPWDPLNHVQAIHPS